MENKQRMEVSASRWAAWRRLAGKVPDDRELSKLDPRNHARAGKLLRGIWRRLSLLDAILQSHPALNWSKTPSPVRWVLRLATYEKIYLTDSPDYAIGDQAVALARKVAGAPAGRFVNAVMRKLLPALPETAEGVRDLPGWADWGPEIRWSVPEEILNVYQEAYGTDAEDVLEALTEHESATWLRTNRLKNTAAELAEHLHNEGLQTETHPLMHDWLRVTGGDIAPWATHSWAEGRMTVQDPGAGLAACIAGIRPGMHVLDACAAPGGKTGDIWERMDGLGRLVAAEINAQRRVTMAEALQRLYMAGHGIEITDADDLSQLSGEFERVIVDGPCLAYGLIGRHPEIRWDRRWKERGELLQRQRQILEQTATRVKPGGRLIWVTCSPSRAENEDQLKGFLRRNSSFEMMESTELIRDIDERMVWIGEGVIRTRPDRMPCDGFCIGGLERKEAS